MLGLRMFGRLLSRMPYLFETDEPCEPTKEFHVRVTQVNDFIIVAEDAADARRQAAEDYIWDENQRHPNRYHADIDVEEIDD
tara:strand:+ start:530 stop:775 length:246 start_codon:yes stop_codon:yes gene_type:complete